MAGDKKMFVVLATGDTAKLSEQIQQQFPETNLFLEPDRWFLVGESSWTTTEVSNKIGVTGSEVPSGIAIILSVGNYFGRAPATVWEWIAAKLGGAHGIAG